MRSTNGTAPIAPYAWVLAGLTIIGFASGYAARVQMFKVAFRVETALRHAVFDHLSRLSASFYDTSETGQLLARANGDIRAVQMFLNFGPFMMLSLVIAGVCPGADVGGERAVDFGDRVARSGGCLHRAQEPPSPTSSLVVGDGAPS